MNYEKLTRLEKSAFRDRKVLLIGAGWMADQYCNALKVLGVSDFTVISRSETSSTMICEKHGGRPEHGGYEAVLPRLGVFDLVIVATPIHELRPAALLAARCGNKNILVEKPGSLYSAELDRWAEDPLMKNARVRLAFNRNTYASFWKLKERSAIDGGITSCRYMFTEWVHTINFSNNRPEVYSRWGISNSLHVIAMAHALIGMPKKISAFREGSLEWHPSGERFSGSGCTGPGVLFSYHADWGSAGRWGIEVMTPMNSYQLIPLEQLNVCKKGTVQWNPVQIEAAFTGVKDGVGEELAVMLEPELEKDIPLVTIGEAARLTSLAEEIFGYEKEPKER